MFRWILFFRECLLSLSILRKLFLKLPQSLNTKSKFFVVLNSPGQRSVHEYSCSGTGFQGIKLPLKIQKELLPIELVSFPRSVLRMLFNPYASMLLSIFESFVFFPAQIGALCSVNLFLIYWVKAPNASSHLKIPLYSSKDSWLHILFYKQ